MKRELVKAAVILGNSENLFTDVMEFYAEVTKVIVKKRRAQEARDKKSMKRMFRKNLPLVSDDFKVE
jgi:hypothetical protein